MPFQPARSLGEPAPARIRIVSPDAAFAAAIGQHLRGWGLTVAIDGDLGAITPSVAADEQLDLVLADVRRGEDAFLRWLSAIKQARPAIEVILLTLPGQVAISIAAMRAGASTELSAPFDVAKLRTAVSQALRRRRKRIAGARPSLLERFQAAMSAATFAQAGEFETAREILAESEGRERSSRDTDGE
jgi:DNA-binding NtrC family response regulator